MALGETIGWAASSSRTPQFGANSLRTRTNSRRDLCYRILGWTRFHLMFNRVFATSTARARAGQHVSPGPDFVTNTRRTRSDLVALSPELLSGLWLTRGRFSRVKIRVRREFASSCRENRARTTPRKLRKSFVGGRMGSLAFLAEEWEWSPTMGWQRYGLRH